MTQEELARFSLILREADRVRAQVAHDEATARAGDDSDSPQLGFSGDRILAAA
jgi:hypothetical protein